MNHKWIELTKGDLLNLSLATRITYEDDDTVYVAFGSQITTHIFDTEEEAQKAFYLIEAALEKDE